jgi:DeoR/GlpR family transcriptional regulator of sugar metabolism
MINRESLKNGVFYMTHNNAQSFYSRAELAELFRVSAQTVIRWEQAGLLTAVHLCSGSVRYSREEVDRFIAAQTEARPTKRRTADAAQA